MSATRSGFVAVTEVMTRDVLTVRPDQPVDAAIGLFLRHRITGVPVVDEAAHVVGVVSESDVLGKRGRTCREVMSTTLHTCTVATSVEEAAEELLRSRIRRMPVLDAEGRLVGIVTRMDLVRHLARTHWACRWCGTTERGLREPGACHSCGGESWRFVAEPWVPSA